MTLALHLSASALFPCCRRSEERAGVPPPRFLGLKFHFRSSPVIFGNLWSSLAPSDPAIGKLTNILKASVLAFVIPGVPNEAVARHLDRHGIAVRAGHPSFRAGEQRSPLAGVLQHARRSRCAGSRVAILITKLKSEGRRPGRMKSNGTWFACAQSSPAEFLRRLAPRRDLDVKRARTRLLRRRVNACALATYDAADPWCQ